MLHRWFFQQQEPYILHLQEYGDSHTVSRSWEPSQRWTRFWVSSWGLAPQNSIRKNRRTDRFLVFLLFSYTSPVGTASAVPFFIIYMKKHFKIIHNTITRLKPCHRIADKITVYKKNSDYFSLASYQQAISK